MKIYDLCDKKILNRNIDGIDHKGVHLGIKIMLREDTRLIDSAFETFLNLESWDNNKEIEAEIEEVDGKKRIITDANIVRGSHPSLMYRGNALKRHKIWFQEDETNWQCWQFEGREQCRERLVSMHQQSDVLGLVSRSQQKWGTHTTLPSSTTTRFDVNQNVHRVGMHARLCLK